jgi:hypothetical protein
MKSTLERIDDLEKQVAALTAKSSVAEILSQSVPVIEQESGQLRKNVDEIVQTIQAVAQNTKRMFDEIRSYDQGVSYKISSLEQSLVSFSKSLGSIFGELVDNHGLSNSNVSARLRKIHEAGLQAETEEKIKLGAIKPAEVVSEASTVIVSETKIEADGTSKLMADYNAIDVASGMLNDEEKAQFLGKKVGDVFEIKLIGQTPEENLGSISVTVKEIYDLVQGTREGEVPFQGGVTFDPPTEAQPDCPTPDSPEYEAHRKAVEETAAVSAANNAAQE